MAQGISFRNIPVTSHGGILIGGGQNTRLQTGFDVSCLTDVHICPIVEEDYAHGATLVVSTGFARSGNSRVTVIGNVCGCGAVVILGDQATKTG